MYETECDHTCCMLNFIARNCSQQKPTLQSRLWDGYETNKQEYGATVKWTGDMTYDFKYVFYL
jgi:hypothetical protein